MSNKKTNVVPFPQNRLYVDALIAPGMYAARVIDTETAVFFYGKSPKVVLWFQICTFGDAFEVIVPAYYAVRAIKGKPQRNGHFVIGFKSRLARDLAAMTCRSTRPQNPVWCWSRSLWDCCCSNPSRSRSTKTCCLAPDKGA